MDADAAAMSPLSDGRQALVALSATVRGLAGAQYRIENPGSATGRAARRTLRRTRGPVRLVGGPGADCER